jgi:hypothetical protein
MGAVLSTPKNQAENPRGDCRELDGNNRAQMFRSCGRKRPPRQAAELIGRSKELMTKKRRQHSIEEIEEAIEKSLGIQSLAAEMLGMTYHGIYKRIKNSDRLKAKLDEASRKAVNFAESKLMSAIKEGNLTAIIFFLKCRGGYSEKSEQHITGDLPPLVFNVIPVSEKPEDSEE